MPGGEEILVETVDEQGRAVGTAEKLEAHREPGVLHRAFSLFAFDGAGRLLLQRRAAGKYHSPLMLTNSACGHPFPGEAPATAVARRAAEELGAPVRDLTELGIVQYHVHDDATGLYEREYNHVFAGLVDAESLAHDPDEIAEIVFVTGAELAALRAAEPFTAWFDDVWGVTRGHLSHWGFRDA
ncbi:isopentenyl-diphosphate Delta-isomerase [Occultella glacieicola]|uniref:Isopentenyl-diphosphate Delta-isomerase n=1 Tax=Occultella glacieicola TaxID=2518684 RepID=A0ABY2DYU4_9MICO|nr:isopentenyl-diphosphate Delta-isomerase [Occultella glacieicola]TDE89657.1 isopentenyl-diphosphate Delta-isomerase [Occultella glacieicola]